MFENINLKYYNGQDSYNDGDVENDILNIVLNNDGNDDYRAILDNNDNWFVFANLVPERRNLLEWYNFKPNSSIIEIGAGPGAITSVLCEKSSKVTAVELSYRRAKINSVRNSKYKNLEIMVGNLNDMEFDIKYDYAVLVGVLEYASAFTNTKNPYVDFLKNIKKLLKDDGIIIIAIENRYGLKYFAGAHEDHTGQIFDGIEGYRNVNWVRTFGKLEITNILKDSGFSYTSFYYPYPDYKTPRVIFSDSRLPAVDDILDYNTPNYDYDKLSFFNEKLALDGIVKNKQYDFFANSFLIFASAKEFDNECSFIKYNRYRDNKFQIETSINSSKKIFKKALKPEGIEHLQNMVKYYNYVKSNFNNINIAESYMIADDVLYMEYIEGDSLKNILKTSIESNDIEKYKFYFNKYIELLKSFNIIEIDYSRLKDFENIFSDYYSDLHGPAMEYANLDLTFSNIIVDQNDNFYIIDYELCFNFYCPLYYIISRVINDFVANICCSFENTKFIYDILSEYYPIYINNIDYMLDKYLKTDMKLWNYLGTSDNTTRKSQLKNITDYRQNISNLKSEIESLNNKHKLEIESLNNHYISEIEVIRNNVNRLAWWIPIRKLRDKFRENIFNKD